MQALQSLIDTAGTRSTNAVMTRFFTGLIGEERARDFIDTLDAYFVEKVNQTNVKGLKRKIAKRTLQALGMAILRPNKAIMHMKKSN